MNELKPCPFCGSKDVRQVEGDEYSWCMNPSCAIYDYEIRINEWNSRAESQEMAALREQVKVLREALGSYAECCDGCTCGDGWSHDIAIEALAQTKPKNEDPEKLARLIASRVNGFGLASARKLVFRLGTLDNIINAEPADLDAIFGKGSIKSIHLRKYLDDPVAVERLRDRLQTKPKEVE